MRDRTRCTHGKGEKSKQKYYLENLKGRGYLEDFGVDEEFYSNEF
jgi:hypothetical protein